MALTLAGHLHRKEHKKSEDIGMNVRQLEIIKPLIAKVRNARESQIVRITATAERPLKSVKISYNSLARDGKVGELHATCVVEYGDTKSWLTDWSRGAYLFRSRIDVLDQGADAGKYKKLGRGPAYKAFSSFVQYDKSYHGMKEVVLDSKNFEATSQLEFQARESDGDFDTNPHWIDNIAHLSGFILNGSDAVDSKKQVYVSHGWQSLQIAHPLSAKKSYRNYVKMLPGPKQSMVGDVYVFDGEEMVALVGGVKFQAIPRAVLNKLLPPINGASAHPNTQDLLHNDGNPSHPKSSKPEIEKEPVQPTTETAFDSTAPVLQSQNDNDSITDEFMSIIVEELGLELSELHDKAAFADVGLDSLMALTITGRIREELDVNAPASLFTDSPTIGEAKAAIITLGGAVSNGTSSTASTSTTYADSESDMTEDTSTEHDTSNDSIEDATEKLLSIVSEEVGLAPSELLDMATFADMGVDSLMSLTISGRIREEVDLDIPTSFFTDHPSISEAKAAISALLSTNKDAAPNDTGYTTSDGTLRTSTSTPEPDADDIEEYIGEASQQALRPATSILLQGNPKTASKSLFLFPDGSGSATSYAAFPGVSPDVAVYGLNCPFMKTPTDYTNGIDGVATQYLAEIKRRQAHGPYYLGGWSAGGVLAYQVAYKLLEMGEKTERLILIDSPCPVNLEPLPSSLLHFVDSLGLLGDQKKTPSWLIPHFEASIVNLAAFVPQPMDPRDAPDTLIIWARDGLVKDPKDQKFQRSAEEPKSVKFLLDNRPSDFGSYGWDKLLGAENITTTFVGGNHFTIIKEPKVSARYDGSSASTF